MKTVKLLIMNVLAAACLGGCTNTEEPVTDSRAEAIEATAGIAETTRAVITGGYANSLEVSFARMDNPDEAGSKWVASAIDATRAGGAGNQVITFESEQSYLPEEGKSVLIGYHPRQPLTGGGTQSASVAYNITGDEDIMATEVQTGSLTDKFEPFTFKHLLTQLQFKCTGSAGAIAKWTVVTSIKVKNVHTTLTLSLDKSTGATLTIKGSANQELTVKNCPQTVTASGVSDPTIGYLLLFPTMDMGTGDSPISLEVVATYDKSSKTLTVPVNIEGGVKPGYSHLITLTFAEDGTIAVEADIAEWQPGNGGSSIVTPSDS